MEPVAIVIICTAVFGIVAGLAAFIRQLILSRDKRLNDLAQKEALILETRELEKLREQMVGAKRFDAHYDMLGNNKQAIWYLDRQIDTLFTKKSTYIDRYDQIMIQESTAIIAGENSIERKIMCDRLKEELDKELLTYDKELNALQQSRAMLWGSHVDLQQYLLAQEKKRNEQLDDIYQRHTSLLEKIYIRHSESNNATTKELIEASSATYRLSLMAPVELLLNYFKLSSNISPDKFLKETLARQDVIKAEQTIIAKPDQLVIDETKTAMHNYLPIFSS